MASAAPMTRASLVPDPSGTTAALSGASYKTFCAGSHETLERCELTTQRGFHVPTECGDPPAFGGNQVLARADEDWKSGK